MNEDIEQINSDANEPSSEAQDSQSGSEKAPAELSTGEKSTNNSPKELPFHEHPRWKEVLEERNTAREQTKRLEQSYQQLQDRINQMSAPKAAPEADKRSAMIERLKGIDPEFADFVSGLAPSQELNELRQWRQQMEQKTFITSAVGTIKDLHSKNNVSPELQAKYERELDLEYRSGRIKSMDDVNAAYKQVHEGYNALLENIKRAERESYLKEKTKASNTPSSQPKGKPVQAGQKSDWSKDPAEARKQLIQKVIKQARASDSI